MRLSTIITKKSDTDRACRNEGQGRSYALLFTSFCRPKWNYSDEWWTTLWWSSEFPGISFFFRRYEYFPVNVTHICEWTNLWWIDNRRANHSQIFGSRRNRWKLDQHIAFRKKTWPEILAGIPVIKNRFRLNYFLRKCNITLLNDFSSVGKLSE